MADPSRGPSVSLFTEVRIGRTPAGRWAATDSATGPMAWDRYLAQGPLRLVCRADPRTGTAAVELPTGVEVVPLPYYRGLGGLVRTGIPLIKAVRGAVRSSEAVIVRLPGIVGSLAGAYCRLVGRRYAVEVVGDPAEALAAGVAGSVGRILARGAGAQMRWVVRGGSSARFVTDAALQHRYPAAPGAPSVPVSNVRLGPGSFVGAARTWSSGPMRLITVGSQEATYKGHDVLLRAVRLLCDEGEDVRLTIVGGGRLHDRYVALARDLGIEARVEFTGVVADRERLLDLLDRATVFVLPSYTEGLPRALIEAMARALPAVGSDISGIRELLDPALLVPAGDAARLAAKLSELGSDPGRWKEQSRRNLRRAHDYASTVLDQRFAAWLAGVRTANASRPTTVLHVLGTLNRGGAETLALDLCRRIPAAEVRQVFVTIGTEEGSLARDFRTAGAQVLRCPLRPAASFPSRLLRTLRTNRPDVVVSHVGLSSGLILAVAAGARVPRRMARVHSTGDGRPDTVARRVQRAASRALLRWSATHVLAVSPAALTFAAGGRRDDRYHVLGNGVDVERFHPRPRGSGFAAGAPVCIHVGRAAPEKNRAFLVPVHAHLRRLYPEARLLLVGTGGVADLQHEPLPPGIEHLGERADVDALLRAADVLLLPSFREGLPGVILEALASGVPVLASDLPSLRELAGQLAGITLLPLEAGPASWAERACELARSSSIERQAMAELLRTSDFTLDASATRWGAVWTQP